MFPNSSKRLFCVPSNLCKYSAYLPWLNHKLDLFISVCLKHDGIKGKNVWPLTRYFSEPDNTHLLLRRASLRHAQAAAGCPLQNVVSELQILRMNV